MKTSIKIKGMIFDMDGTLIDSLFFFNAFWKSIGERYFGNPSFRPDPIVDKKARTEIYPKALQMIAEAYRISDEHFVEEYVAYLENFYRHEVSAKPGAVELLSFLKEQGIPICIASASCVEYLELALRACGLRQYIDSLHSCEDVGVGKERPDVFFKAAESMGLNACDVCVVEDSFLALESAGSVGFHTVGVYDPYAYEQERLRKASEIYLEKGQMLSDLIEKLQF